MWLLSAPFHTASFSISIFAQLEIHNLRYMPLLFRLPDRLLTLTHTILSDYPSIRQVLGCGVPAALNRHQSVRLWLWFCLFKKLPPILQWSENLYPLQLWAFFKRQFASVFLGPAKNFFWISEIANVVGVLFEQEDFTMQESFRWGEIRFSPLTAELEQQGTATTCPSKWKIC